MTLLGFVSTVALPAWGQAEPRADAYDEYRDDDAAVAAGGGPKQGVEQRDDDTQVSPAELAEIEAALGADAKSTERQDPGAPTENDRQSGSASSASSVVATAAALLPDIAVITDVALAAFSDEEPLQGGGHDPTATGFNLQQVELSLSKSVDPYFRFDANLVFSLEGVEVEEAYASTLALPGSLQLRAGQFLTRFGRMNATHPHSWDFVDQPFVLTKVFGGEGNRGLGAELSWLTPLPWYLEVLGSTNGAAGDETTRSFYGADDQGVKSPADLQNTLAIKQFFDLSEDWSLMWGASLANGPNAYREDGRSDIYGTDVYLKYRPITRQSFTVVSLQSEWIYRRREVPFGVLHDVGGYAQLFWRYAQRWGTSLRYEYGTPTYDAGSNTVAIDPLDPEQTSARQRVSSAVTFWPSDFSRLRLQGSSDFPGWRPKPIVAGFLALEVVIGSHGAHPF